MKNKFSLQFSLLLLASTLFVAACGTGSEVSKKDLIPPQVFLTESSSNLQNIGVKSGMDINVNLGFIAGRPSITESSVLLSIKLQEESIAIVNPSQCILRNNESCTLTITGLKAGNTNLNVHGEPQSLYSILNTTVPVIVTTP